MALEGGLLCRLGIVWVELTLCHPKQEIALTRLSSSLDLGGFLLMSVLSLSLFHPLSLSLSLSEIKEEIGSK